MTRTTSFSRAQQKYLEQNRDWNELNQMGSRSKADVKHFEHAYATNLEYFERVQTKTVEIFQGLQKRGTTAHFDATELAIVRSDGRSVRLPIGGKTLPASSKIIGVGRSCPDTSVSANETICSREAMRLLTVFSASLMSEVSIEAPAALAAA